MDFSVLSEQIGGQDVFEWVGLITGVLYVILATYERPSCWIFGIVSSAAIAWKSFDDYKLIADGILQVFYVLMGFLGLWNWISGRESGKEKPIISLPIVQHSIAITLCFILSFPI
ncbi:MAG: nicotinamide riboside transporter PnuC, partial [Saprospiraceae bacterium]